MLPEQNGCPSKNYLEHRLAKTTLVRVKASATVVIKGTPVSGVEPFGSTVPRTDEDWPTIQGPILGKNATRQVAGTQNLGAESFLFPVFSATAPF